MDGIIIINKPQDWTSNDVVQKVKHKLKANKVGHTGTLDPIATGVLPLLINKGTKLSQYLTNHDKEYTATLLLGKKSDTGDRTGNIIEEKEVPELSNEKIEEVLKSFEGKIEQTPPMYSAIKVNGRKLYEYARKGETVEIEPRKIELYSLELIARKDNFIKFHVACSKGTYIRTLCEDIAEKLGTVGLMQELERTRVGEFDIKNGISIDNIIEMTDDEIQMYPHFIDFNEFIKIHNIEK